MFWKTRLDAGITGDPYKTIVTYKETYPGVPADPSDTWTGLWRDPNGLSQGGGKSENSLTGLQFEVNLGTPLATLDIPAEFSKAAFNARETEFIPAAMKTAVLAHTTLAGPGESVEVTIKVPAKAGSYPYLCSFPGHFALGMKGTLAVK